MDVVRVARLVHAVGDRTTWRRERIEELQRTRLAAILDHARTSSPFYGRRANGELRLQDVEPIGKVPFIENFDQIVTDRVLRYEQLEPCLESSKRAGRFFFLHGRYAVLMTGGTSGVRIFVPWERKFAALQTAMLVSRVVRATFTRRRPRWTTLGGDPGVFGSAFLSMFMPSMFARKRLIQPQASTETLARSLAEDPPELLTMFPSVARRLAAEQASGRMKLAPAGICLIGENSPVELRESLSTVFRCPVQVRYTTTETGCLAQTCSSGNLHLNEDVAFVEVVDKDDRPVPAGTLGDALLVTDLWRREIPLIRYRLGDRIALGEGPCPCGSAYRWIASLEGRSGDLIEVPATEGGRCHVVGYRLWVVFISFPSIAGAEVTFTPPGAFDVNLVLTPGSDKETTFAAGKKAFEEYLAHHGADLGRLTISLRAVDDLRRTESGKGFNFRVA